MKWFVRSCVTDNLPGLTWAKNGNLANKPMPWLDALKYVAEMNANDGLCSAPTGTCNIVELGLLPNKDKADSDAWLSRGTPFPYRFVAFFRNVKESGEHQDYGVSKRSPLMVAFIKDDGKFTTQLFPAGSYFIGAVMQEKWIGGPPKKGQERYSAIDSEGEYRLYEVKAAETLDIGTVTVRLPSEFPELKKQFIVQGRVLDDQGRGVINSVVVAKKDIDDPKGVFISAETDSLGVYQLKISPGKFYFVARKTLTRAGRPAPGGLMGTLGQNKPIGIGGKSEELPAYIIGKDGDVFKKVDIVMFEVPIPDVKRKEIEAQVKAKKIDKNLLPENLPLMKPKGGETVPSDYKPE